jgi:hypothetical protein
LVGPARRIQHECKIDAPTGWIGRSDISSSNTSAHAQMILVAELVPLEGSEGRGHTGWLGLFLQPETQVQLASKKETL